MKWFIGIIVMALAVIATSFLNLGDNIVYFYTPKEVIGDEEKAGRTIKVGGLVKPQSVEKTDRVISFVLTDDDGSEVYVTYNGIPPDMFKENQGVIAEGRLSGETLVAVNLMVKHSEEYKVDDHLESKETYLLRKDIFKNQRP